MTKSASCSFGWWDGARQNALMVRITSLCRWTCFLYRSRNLTIDIFGTLFGTNISTSLWKGGLLLWGFTSGKVFNILLLSRCLGIFRLVVKLSLESADFIKTVSDIVVRGRCWGNLGRSNLGRRLLKGRRIVGLRVCWGPCNVLSLLLFQTGHLS